MSSIEMSSIASFVVDCIPVVGTVKQGVEFADAVHKGDTSRAVEKGVGTAVSLFFDLTGAASLYNAVSAGAKMGAKKVAQKGAQKATETGVKFVFKQTAKEYVVEKIVEEGGKKVTTRFVAKQVVKECSVHASERVICLLAAKGVCHCANCNSSQKQVA